MLRVSAILDSALILLLFRFFDKLKRLCSFSTFQALFLDFKITPTLSGNFEEFLILGKFYFGVREL